MTGYFDEVATREKKNMRRFQIISIIIVSIVFSILIANDQHLLPFIKYTNTSHIQCDGLLVLDDKTKIGHCFASNGEYSLKLNPNGDWIKDDSR